MTKHGGGEAVYGLGLIGVLIYYLQHAKGIVDVLLGILKSVVWPALLTFKLFGFLRM